MRTTDILYLSLAHAVAIGLWSLGVWHAGRGGKFLKMDKSLAILAPVLAFAAPFVIVLLYKLELI